MAGLLACGGHTGDPAPRTIDPTVEAEAVAATAISRSLQVTFDWRLEDREARFNGQGVARIEANRARVDLFGPRGEAYISAVLDGFQLRLPPGAEDPALPPPPLFWSVLGVFRAPPGAQLVAATRDGTRSDLEYTDNEGTWRFRIEGETLRRAEWTGRQDGRRTVELSNPGAGGVPAEATYRDWPAFLQLRLSPTDVREVNGFPTEIWTLGRD